MKKRLFSLLLIFVFPLWVQAFIFDSPLSPSVTIPSAPTGVTPTAGDTQVSVAYSASSGATSYNGYWAATSEACASKTKVTGIANPWVKTGLTDGTPYYFNVTAVNSVGESTCSSEVSATPVAPIVVTNIGTNYNSSGTTLAISSSVNVPAGAMIFVAVAEFSASSIGSLSDGSNTYTSGSLSLYNNGKAMYFYVLNATARSNITLTYTKNSSANHASMSAFYATNIATSAALDTAVTVTRDTYSSATNPLFTSTSGTPAVAGELFVAVLEAIKLAGNGSDISLDTSHGWSAPLTAVTSDIYDIIIGGTQVNSGTGTEIFAPVNADNTNAVYYSSWILGFKHQ
jgi:cellulose 1,4-beta-cellobiosidase